MYTGDRTWRKAETEDRISKSALPDKNFPTREAYNWSCGSCMLCHATTAHFRKDARILFSALCHVFTRPIRKVANPWASRAYCVKKLSDFDQKPRFVNQASLQTNACATKRQCDEHAGSPSTDQTTLQRNSKYHLDEDALLRPAKRPHPSNVPTPIVPSSKWELYQEILRLISLNPPAPFSRLMSLHQREPSLQSVESYNLLLHLSIRHSFFRHTRSLINSMALNKIQPNLNTEKLVVRHLVTNGKWKQAWQRTVKRYPLVDDIPMPVLLELLAPGTRNFPGSRIFRSRHPPSGVESPPHPRSLNHLDANEEIGKTVLPLDTLIIILHRFQQLPVDELARLPPRVISYAVRGLIRNGHEEEAIALTEKHLKGLPPEISPRRIDFARELVHLHLSVGEVKLATYKRKRRLVERLFSMYPHLSPNSQTVFLLMRYMKGSKRCGIEAYQFYKAYRARWGAAVESLEVKRRIIAYAMKQRKYGIAKEISQEGPLEGPSPSHQQAARGESDSLWRVRRWRTMYPRNGRGLRFWKRLVIRLLGKRRGMHRMRRSPKRRHVLRKKLLKRKRRGLTSSKSPSRLVSF